MLALIVKQKDKKMAKKDKIKEDVTEVSAEITEEKKPTPEKKKSHFGRNLTVFVFLLLCGAVAFSAMQLKQTEALNKRAMQELQRDYEQKLSAVISKVNGLQKEVTRIKNEPLPSNSDGVSEEFVNQRLEQLKQEIMQHETNENVGEFAVAQPIAVEGSPTKQTQEILLASGAMVVRDLAEKGNKFEYEAEVLQILAQGNPPAEKYVETVQKFAASGIKGKNQLIKSFNQIFADLDTAKVKAETEHAAENPQNWKDRIIAWAKKIFVSKKGAKRPVFKEKEDEVYVLVNEGNLGEALNVLKTSEKYAGIESSPLVQWQAQVNDYMEFSRAISGLIMNSIANLHLKEMEH